MSIARYKRIVPLGRKIAGPIVAITIAFSFLATLVPLANASLSKTSTMACCAGKAAGHCDSGLAAKKVPPPKSEPMCGLHGAEMEDDGITVVAQPSHAESQESLSQTAETNTSQPGAESASLSQRCRMDCAACATGATRQQKRERVLEPATHQHSSLTTQSLREDQALLFSLNEEWEQIIPRGPPSHLR